MEFHQFYFNFTALHLSAQSGDIKIVDLLLKQKDIDVNLKTILILK